jgi:hypothetical protein
MAEEVATNGSAATTADQTQQVATTTAAQTPTNIIENKSGMQVGIKSNAANVGEALDNVVNEGQPATADSTQTAQNNPQQAQTETQQLSNAQGAMDGAEQDLKAKGVDFAAIEKEYADNGGLSQQSYNTLANSGYPKTVVDGLINGWQAASERYVTKVTDMAGGQQGLSQIQEFVKSKGDAMRNAYNAAINSNDLGQIQLVFDGIKSQMTKEYGTTNRPSIIGGNAPSVSVQGYQTTAEMVKDMSDPRYQTDAKFTEDVYRKVKNSTLF